MGFRTWFRLKFGRFLGLKNTTIAVADSAAQTIVDADKRLDQHEATVEVHNIALKGLAKRKETIVAKYDDVDSRAKDLLASL